MFRDADMVETAEIRQELDRDVFDYQQLTGCLSHLSKPRDKINKLLRRGDIVRIRNSSRPTAPGRFVACSDSSTHSGRTEVHDAIRSMLNRHDCQTRDDYVNALREILQELALLSFGIRPAIRV